MIADTRNSFRRAAGRTLLATLLLAGGCGQLSELVGPAVPGVEREWTALLGEIRQYERAIGFAPTANFAALSREQREFLVCGYASQLALPYSYEDPAITWADAKSEQDCRLRGRDGDVYFSAVEAWGESQTPVTPAMISGRLDRFIYLVIHEDCHDQFELPYGIEEALCNLVAYKGMAAFTAEKYGHFTRENYAALRYADTQTAIARATIAYYEQLEKLYARHRRSEISAEELLRERAVIFKAAERPLGWARGDFNNVRLANHMTYSRHFPLLESVLEKLGSDMARTVAFFKRVDAIKPPRAAVLARYGISDEYGVEAVRAYEAAVVETINAALPKVL